MFIKNVLALYGLLCVITSNRRSQFISNFWKKFCEIFKIDRKLLTIYYPQIDKLIERINLIIKIYFRVFVDWD